MVTVALSATFMQNGPNEAAMIIVRIQGGLGNQLFQYAAGLRLARVHNVELKLDTRFYDTKQREDVFENFEREFLLDRFAAEVNFATNDDVSSACRSFGGTHLMGRMARKWRQLTGMPTSRRISEQSSCFDASVLRAGPNVYLDGYWQQYRYFIDQQESIAGAFELNDESIRRHASDFVNNLRSDTRTVVAVHVRRGDYLLAQKDEKLKKELPPTMPATYFKEAMRKFTLDTTFLVFSDSPEDLAWCVHHLSDFPTFFAEGNSTLEDFALMRECDHNIISNSTFSWWAAWLNTSPNKRVIAPSVWHNLTRHPNFDVQSFLPPSWEIVNAA